MFDIVAKSLMTAAFSNTREGKAGHETKKDDLSVKLRAQPDDPFARRMPFARKARAA